MKNFNAIVYDPTKKGVKNICPIQETNLAGALIAANMLFGTKNVKGVIEPEKPILKEVQKRAEDLSSEWNNTGYVVKNTDGSIGTTVWNKWKDENPQRQVIAYVNRDGWKLKSADYFLEK